MKPSSRLLFAITACAVLLGACERTKPPPESPVEAVRPTMDTQPLELIGTAATNLLSNGDFEAGSFTGWSTYGSYKYVGTTASSPPFKVHGGTYSAQIGSYKGAAGTSYIYQTLTVPSAGATLSFWWYPICYDSVSYDQQWVEIHSSTGALLATVLNDCNNAQTWAQVTYDLTPYAGQTVQLRFGDTDDGYVSTDQTYYFLDDVLVTAKGAANDFSVAVSPSSQSVAAGGSATYTVTTAVTSGSAQTVNLSVTGLPAGVTGSFSPASVTAGGSATLTLTASSTAAATTATFTVTGSATSGSHSATASVSVTASTTNDFSIAISPSSQSVAAGGSISYSVTTAVTSGIAQTVNLSVAGLPAGVTGSFSPASVTAGSDSTLTVTASSTAAAATATFSVTGSAPSGSHSASASVSVTANNGGTGVGPNGGTVDHLYFAVVGDTRPGSLDATSSYPTAIINKIYQDINALSPRPQFVVGTGDYMFASTTGGQAATQVGYYKTATQYYTGTVFAAIGNHECDGYTADNCTLGQTDNINQYMSALVTPLGKSQPYYTINVSSAVSGQWTSKIIIVACNVWSTTQKSWLQQQLATPTTYTLLVRHEPAAATTGPCVNDVETLMAQYPYNLSLVGHTHTFTGSAGSKEVIVGTGGAPQTSVPYGFATVERTASGWQIKQYDYSTNTPVNTFTVP